MTDLQLLQAAVNGGGIMGAIVILWITIRELLKLVNKMVDAQGELINKLGETIAENQQTYLRVRELIEETKRGSYGRTDK